jgi:predicted metal-dependent hydrolase
MSPIVRNLRFQLDESIPKYWMGGRKSVSIFLDNLSVFFPAGERFFVKSVRAHQDFVKDDQLAQEVRGFNGQEGLHTREHEAYNAWLQRQGYPIEELEKRVEAILDGVSNRAPDDMQLAVTCALEHFTALLGGALLNDPKLLEGAHPAMAALWKWHAAEENEHKSVAFDVYRAAGGSYPVRALAMLGATAIFWGKVIQQQAIMMKSAGIAGSPAEWISLLRYLFIEPGGMLALLGPYLSYFRPGFHPSQHDSQKLFDGWMAEYESSPVYAKSVAAARAPRRGPEVAPAT